MATTGVGFRWLDLLEKEFDKACVELDTSLMEMEVEEPESVFSARQKIATLTSCFAQLTHKALTIFQNSAKIEAELVDMRAELIQARATSNVTTTEDGKPASSEPDCPRSRLEAVQLARENTALRETVLALHSELFGARLATKYLDKELAGRIQQLQLLGRDMRAELRDSLWAQVEAEILLQRHKTLVRVCRGLAPCPPRPQRSPHAPPAPPRPRTVRVRRSPHLGLGISVTGGREHGVPILISELEAGGPAALTGELYVGDAILAINDVDLTQACHKEAVQALQSVKGDCALCVQFIATDDDDRLSQDNYRFPLYPEDGEVFAAEPDGSGATPTAPRTPDFNRPHSNAGSGSECESPGYTEVPYRLPQAPYADYNSINNNLSILDMDDESIKIEAEVATVRPASPPGSPVLTRDRPRPRQRGAYRSLPADVSSSNDSPHSTPVHGRRPHLKKKRVKSGDWRSKGAYRAVDDELHSSDEVQKPPVSPVNGHGISTVYDKPEVFTDDNRRNADDSPKTQQLTETSDLSPPEPQPQPQPLEVRDHRPIVALPPPQDVILPSLVRSKLVISKTNGLENKLLQSNTFRIGSAKRISESTALTNGDSVVNHRMKCPQQLVLTGDGDPDFGTPV